MLVIGISTTELTEQECQWLQHPAVSGVILFSRNFHSRQQVVDLVKNIRSTAKKPFLICVDQEGGPVQRFRDGFTALPALSRFGEIYKNDPAAAKEQARDHAWLMASEILSLGIDISFAPVVDLARGNKAIGTRAFDADPLLVAEFTKAYIEGMHQAGMAATIKHFPGHGTVLEDTHFDNAVDDRELSVIEAEDLVPFVQGIASGAEAVMMAHVVYPKVDKDPAGYSHFWIQEKLRAQMKFKGIVFSDDIGMAAAFSAGGVKARIQAHLDCGCDLVLVCAADLVAESLAAVGQQAGLSADRLNTLLARQHPKWDALVSTNRYDQIRNHLASPILGA